MERENKSILLYGINAVMEKLKASPQEVSEVIIACGPQRRVLRSLEKAARRLGLRVSQLEAEALDRLAGGQKHQGIVARVNSYAYFPLADLLESVSSSSGPDRVLILDGLTDPGNFGALLRTAEAVGIRDVVIPKDRAVGVTPAVVKASAGASHHLRICRVTNLRRAVSALKKRGFWIVGLDAQAKENIYSMVYPDRLGVVLGSEGSGIRPLILRECDYLASIPMKGRVGSLNVSVSGAVFLYELLRRGNQG